jgi:REP element-mobilizing transposase RayT
MDTPTRSTSSMESCLLCIIPFRERSSDLKIRALSHHLEFVLNPCCILLVGFFVQLEKVGVCSPYSCANLGLEANAPLGHVDSGMPQSLSAVYIHLVFSTKDRRPLLRDKPTRDALHAYLGSISKQLDCAPIQIGGVEDHVHILARFGRTITQAEWVKELKRVSNLWLKERGHDYADFEWQGGYADFSVSQSKLPEVKEYIVGQEEHHRKMSFQDELRALLRKHEVEWDEKYVWD